MAYSKTLFGTMPDGSPVYAYTLVNSRGTECTLLDLGAIWNRMAVRDRYGNKRDVILGYDQPESYLTDAAFSARWWGATPTASPVGISPWRGRNTSWR